MRYNQEELTNPVDQAQQALLIGKPALALQICLDNAQQNDKNHKLLYLAAIAARKAGKTQLALDIAHQLENLLPKNHAIIFLLVDCLLGSKKPKTALKYLRMLFQEGVRSPNIFFQLGNACSALHELKSAIEYFDQAVEQDKNFVAAWINKGLAEQSIGRWDSAMYSFDTALAIDPNSIDATWNKALLALSTGDYATGFKLYETRWENASLNLKKNHLMNKIWLGEKNLSGKTILLHAEGGLGDTIQFARYVNLFATDVNVLMQCHQQLVDTFRNSNLRCEVFAFGDIVPRFDYHCPLMSLPLAFGTSFENVPSDSPYIFPQADRVAQWNNILGPSKKKRVVICWRGNKNHTNDQNRSIPLEKIIEAFKPCYEWISVQKELLAEERSLLRVHDHIRHFGDEIKTFSDTSAVCHLADITLSVDTSVGHIAGAIGSRVALMVPFCPDWRWNVSGQTTPWYPNHRIIRQMEPGNWDGVISEIGNIERLFGIA